MAKLVDALVSGASPVKRVEVRVFFWAPFFILDWHMKRKKINTQKSLFSKQTTDIEMENAKEVALFIMRRSNPVWWNSRKLSLFYKKRQQKMRC